MPSVTSFTRCLLVSLVLISAACPVGAEAPPATAAVSPYQKLEQEIDRRLALIRATLSSPLFAQYSNTKSVYGCAEFWQKARSGGVCEMAPGYQVRFFKPDDPALLAENSSGVLPATLAGLAQQIQSGKLPADTIGLVSIQTGIQSKADLSKFDGAWDREVPRRAEDLFGMSLQQITLQTLFPALEKLFNHPDGRQLSWRTGPDGQTLDEQEAIHLAEESGSLDYSALSRLGKLDMDQEFDLIPAQQRFLALFLPACRRLEAAGALTLGATKRVALASYELVRWQEGKFRRGIPAAAPDMATAGAHLAVLMGSAGERVHGLMLPLKNGTVLHYLLPSDAQLHALDIGVKGEHSLPALANKTLVAKMDGYVESAALKRDEVRQGHDDLKKFIETAKAQLRAEESGRRAEESGRRVKQLEQLLAAQGELGELLKSCQAGRCPAAPGAVRLAQRYAQAVRDTLNHPGMNGSDESETHKTFMRAMPINARLLLQEFIRNYPDSATQIQIP